MKDLQSFLMAGKYNCHEDGRLRQVAELLTPMPTTAVVPAVGLPSECYGGLLSARRALLESALASVRALVEFDDKLGRYYSTRVAQDSGSRGLAEAVRAAASCVTCGSDWAALLMLAHERGIEVTETQLVDIVRREAPTAPQCSKQMLQNAWWDTHRRRFPNWQPEGIRFDKFQRHCRVAAAALPLIPVKV